MMPGVTTVRAAVMLVGGLLVTVTACGEANASCNTIPAALASIPRAGAERSRRRGRW